MKVLREQIEIPGMRDDDIRRVLNSKGLLQDFEAGEIVCCVCGMPVSWENLGGLIPTEEGLRLCCASADCLEQVVKGRKS